MAAARRTVCEKTYIIKATISNWFTCPQQFAPVVIFGPVDHDTIQAGSSHALPHSSWNVDDRYRHNNKTPETANTYHFVLWLETQREDRVRNSNGDRE